MIEDDVEWALRIAIDLLEEWHPDFEEDSIVSQIVNIYEASFD